MGGDATAEQWVGDADVEREQCRCRRLVCWRSHAGDGVSSIWVDGDLNATVWVRQRHGGRGDGNAPQNNEWRWS